MNPLSSSLAVLLLQWTVLFALGWGAHALLRKGDPRWRLVVWRTVLGVGLALPLFDLLRVPRLWSISPPRFAESPVAVNRTTPEPQVSIAATSSPVSTSSPRAPFETVGGALRPDSNSLSRSSSLPLPSAEKSSTPFLISWPRLLAILWAFGAAWHALRLLRVQLQLRGIIRNSSTAGPAVQALAAQIQRELGIRRPVRVRAAPAISSPFLCGLFRPAILLPQRLAEEIPSAELAALLSHELAHERRSDLVWCILWQAARAIFWFHPLAWWIPEAHRMACEEEADRIAAERTYEGTDYSRLLAQLALRVLSAPPLETPLALSAGSHLARRLLRLGRERVTVWGARHVFAAGGVMLALLILTAGWQFAQPAGTVAVKPVSVPMATVLVSVRDADGQPVRGATITPTGMRAKEERLRTTGYGWAPDRHGPVVKAVTNEEGMARVMYPVAIVAAEKILTGEIQFSVDHPEFASEWVRAYPVDGPGKPVTLTRGIPLRVKAFFGPDRQRVAEIVPTLLGEAIPVKFEDWQLGSDGGLVWRRMTRGKHFLHLSGRLPSGEQVYSEGYVFFGEQRDAHDLAIEMKPGVRIDGRLDAKVPRPIKNGWVQLSVHDDEANTRENREFLPRSFGNTGFWFSYRPIAADGTFVFESVPLGDYKVIAYGDGFISANGPPEERSTPPGIAPPPPRRATRSEPQLFAGSRPVTTIEIATEPTATLGVTLKANGRPVRGAKLYIWPNVANMPSGSRLFAGSWISNEAPFRQLPPLPEPVYSIITDENGTAEFKNVPAFTSDFAVEHAEFEVPLRQPERDPRSPTRYMGAPNRYVAFTVAPGESIHVDLNLQPKGREFAGVNP